MSKSSTMNDGIKLTPAQARTLREVIKVFDDGFRKWSCVPNYKPAIALLKLGSVKKNKSLSDENYRLVLEPTEDGRTIANR